jgi:biopolymer transport protein TolR
VLNNQNDPIVITVDKAGKLFLQETELDATSMVARLQAGTNNDPNITIYVRGDKDIVYGKVMQIMGTIASAGFQKVSLLAELPIVNIK